MLSLAQVHVLSAVIAATKSTTSTKTSSGSAEFFIVLVLLAGFYFLYVRPRRAKMMAGRRQAGGQTARTEIEAGDTVVTSSGIIGRVLSVDGDRASVEIAPDTVVEFHRSTLGRRLDPEPPDENDRWASLTTEGDGDHGTPKPNEPSDEHEPTHDAGDSATGPTDPGPTDDEPGGVE